MAKHLNSTTFVSFQNPSKPHFNHYLFESLCVAIRTACKLNPETVKTFEEALFTPFTEILQQDVQGKFGWSMKSGNVNIVVTISLLCLLGVNGYLRFECEILNLKLKIL